MESKQAAKPTIASMINEGVRSTTKLVENYTAALSKGKTTVKTPAGTQGQGDRKSVRQPPAFVTS